MKNLKVNKALVTLGMALGITLLSSCGENVDDKDVVNDEVHKHLYVTVGDEIIAFKECEGYKIVTWRGGYNDYLSYQIFDYNNNKLFYGETVNYNLIDANHSNTDTIDEFIESNEKVKVYTLDK